jgi:cold shock CspA family protein
MSEKNTKQFDAAAPRDITKEKNLPAKVQSWNSDRGFGFLRLETGERVFCHIKSLCFHLRPEDKKGLDQGTSVVVRSVRKEEQGFAAKSVECLDCAAPEIWELRPTGKSVLGVEEIAPVCINKERGQHEKDFFSFQDVWNANESFRKAEARLQRFQWVINEDFFKEFGEPHSIRKNNEESIILSYGEELGEKKVSLYNAFYCGHFPVSSVGEPIPGEAGNISYVFQFDTIPEASLSVYVAYYSLNPNDIVHPELNSNFEKLTSEQQEKVIEIVKQYIKTPEELAQLRFSDKKIASVENSTFDTTREKCIQLQSPGEAYSFEENIREWESYPESDDGYRSAGTMLVINTYAYLVVGAYKNYGQYEGGHKFSIGCKAKREKTPEELRKDLLLIYTKEIDQEFARIKNIGPLPEDSRIYDITKEEWQSRYDAAWKVLEEAKTAEWKVVDEKKIQEAKDAYDLKVNTQEMVKAVSDRIVALSEKARKYYINTDFLDRPSVWTSEHDDIEQIRRNIQILSEYETAIQNCITENLLKYKEVDVSEEDYESKMNEPAEAATWFVPTTYEKESIIADLEKYGRKNGEGFGLKVAGKQKYLPGDKAVLALNMGTSRRRFSERDIRLNGLSLFGRQEVPAIVCKSSFELRALVQDANWSIQWVKCHDNVPYTYSFANASGIAELTLDDQYPINSRIQSSDWQGNDGAGPTMQEVIRAHNLNNTRQRDVAPLLREAKQTEVLPQEKAPAFVPDPNYEAPQNLADFAARVNAEQRGLSRAEPVNPKKAVVQYEQPAIDVGEMRRKCEDALASIEIFILGLANFKKEVATTLVDKMKTLRAEYLELLSEIQKPEVNVVSLQGKISTLRNSLQALYKANGSKAIEGYDFDWMKKYEDLKMAAIAFVNQDSEVSEYISEGIFTKDALQKEIQKVLAMKVINLQKGKTFTAAELVGEALQKCL